MARYKIKSLSKLMTELQALPGIGPRSAERVAIHILTNSEEKARALAEAILQVKEKIRLCEECFNLAEEALCPICKDPSRSRQTLCVVEEPKDVLLFESAGGYHGLYHVLHGVLAPLDGIGPDQLKFDALKRRLSQGEVKEVILATRPNTEGEATALYAQKVIRPFRIKTTRIACGLPVGADLDYVDVVTLSRSLEGRREL